MKKQLTLFIMTAFLVVNNACSIGTGTKGQDPNSPKAVKLAFSVQPSSSGVATIELNQQPVVSVLDSLGNPVPSAQNTVSLSAYKDFNCVTSSVSFSTVSKNPSEGLSNFSGVKFLTFGSYYLKASSSGLTSACSSLTTITALPPVAMTTAVILSQPTYGVKNTDLNSDLHFNFLDNNSQVKTPPENSSYSISAYSDSTCSTLASGTLTYTLNKTSTEVDLAAIKYSKAEDIYVGIQGSSVMIGCSNVINLVSSVPTNFTINSGDGQAGVVTSYLVTPVVFEVFDATNQLVQNIKIKVNTQVSAGSDSSGLASLTLQLGTVTGDQGYNAILSYGGVDVDSKILLVTVLPGTATSLVVADQDLNTTVQVNTLSNPIFLKALDQYLNIVHPSSYTFSWATYTDSSCTTSGLDVSNFSVIGNPNLSPTDTSTWTNLFFYSFNQVGSYYLKFTLTPPDSGSVCSKLITINP